MSEERYPRWRNRATGDVLILMVTATICFVVIVSGVVIAVVTFVDPGADVSVWVNRNTGILNTMLGVVAGFLAGRSDLGAHRHQDPPEEGSTL